MRRALRYEIPVDGNVHLRTLPGPTLHVASRGEHVVEMWCEDEGRPRDVALTVAGTGHPWPDKALHLGTALVRDSPLVWHLLLVPIPRRP